MTSLSPLERLASPGNVLGKEPPDAKEFAGLVRSGLARLKTQVGQLQSEDGQHPAQHTESAKEPRGCLQYPSSTR